MSMAAKKADTARARTRIGSDDALRWARRIRINNPYAKSILRAVANYMNEDGAAWPGVDTIALDTDIAPDTVVARLRWCESIGAIVLLRCWVDENGRRNYDGRGRTTSTEIRFLFDADLDEIESNATNATKPRVLRGAALAAHEAKALSPRPDGELNEDHPDADGPRPGREQTDVSSGLAPEQPPPRADRTEELDSKKDSPLPPKGGEAQPDDGWKEFEEAWQEPILRQSIARQVWSALTVPERDLAKRAAHGYVLWRKRQPKPPNVINAHTFLREADAHPRYAAIATSRDTTSLSLVKIDSTEGTALAVIHAVARMRPLEISPGEFTLRGEPTAQLLAMAEAPPRPSWQWIEDRNKIGAWHEFVVPWVSKNRPEFVIERNGMKGIFAPWPWPPRKDGSLCTGPPDQSSAEQAAEEFAKLT
jgi:hypothetical protein